MKLIYIFGAKNAQYSELYVWLYESMYYNKANDTFVEKMIKINVDDVR